MRGVIPAGLVVGVVTASALTAAGPGAMMPLKDVVTAAGDVAVAFVVDFGSAGVKSACVTVPSSDNGYAALLAFTQQENEAAPTYNSTQLLCSIGGIPSSGCGQADDNGYIYWSYWHGTSGTWVYANTGAFDTVTNGDVEGWRFQDPGAGNPTDPPPRTSPNYASICGSSLPTTTVAATPPPVTSPPATPNQSAPTTRPHTQAPPPSATPTTTTPVTGQGASTDDSSPTTSPLDTPSTVQPRIAAAGASVGATGPSDDATPLVITGVIVAALAGLATLRRRRRLRSP